MERLLREVQSKWQDITNALISRNMSITTMESCTSGLIASLITDIEGASSIFKGADVTYSNGAKIAAGVPEMIIKLYGVYSKETAMAMASTCKHSYGADIGIGVTGTTGNIDPENTENSIPGVVFFAIAMKDETIIKEIKVSAETRFEYKLKIAEKIADELLHQEFIKYY